MPTKSPLTLLLACCCRPSRRCANWIPIVSGKVTEASGAIVPNAPVKVVETKNNFESLTLNNAEGLFQAASRRPRAYRVTVIAGGFKQHVR